MAWRKSEYFPSALNWAAFSPSRFASTSQTATMLPNLLAAAASPVPIPPHPTSRMPGLSLGDLGSSAAAWASVSSTNQRGRHSAPARAAPDFKRSRRLTPAFRVIMVEVLGEAKMLRLASIDELV